MDQVDQNYQALARWIEANGYEADGQSREIYLDCPEDVSAWVTELQMAVRKP